MDESMTFLIYLYTLIWRYAVRVYMLYVYILHGVRLNGQYGSWSTYIQHVRADLEIQCPLIHNKGSDLRINGQYGFWSSSGMCSLIWRYTVRMYVTSGPTDVSTDNTGPDQHTGCSDLSGDIQYPLICYIVSTDKTAPIQHPGCAGWYGDTWSAFICYIGSDWRLNGQYGSWSTFGMFRIIWRYSVRLYVI